MPHKVGNYKVCARCRVKKHIDEYCKDKSRLDGLDYECKECKNKRHKEYKKRKRAENPDAWIKKQTAQTKKYRKTPNGRVRHNLAMQRRRSRVKESIVDLHPYDIEFLLHFQHGRCGCCKRKFSSRLKYQLDHVKPLIDGGNLVLNNVQLLCRNCNAQKYNKEIRYIPELSSYFEDWT